ncbi:hypothetical protein CAPTEDRAFT_216376 [Capitella teleta]|uniref:SHSP domain-containing protein n=1 Tax=Capitella teleta TaxID=283909 RepID=R7U825_CAPTE|nr:hypothetical protein CAPTEDRAFT_216376 [Capitella teleta]|eukprot:ELT99796.1 hypothetical protein CAPTEDRAFT_216376 [Capitella teleta]
MNKGQRRSPSAMSSSKDRRLVPVTSLDGPLSVNDLEKQMSMWHPLAAEQSDPTWREFMREQARIDRDVERLSEEMTRRRPEDESRPVVNSSPGPEILTWPAPVIKQQKNGVSSFYLDVNIGDTYRPDEIHVNIIDGHVLHIYAEHGQSRRRVKDDTLSASRQHSEFDRRFALPDHHVKPENLSCLVTPEGVLHIRGFLGSKIVPLKSAVKAKKEKAPKSKVNFAVFGKKSR